ncbi:MAG: hypothetical protein ACI4TK_15855 [Agathobacter sp.]
MCLFEYDQEKHLQQEREEAEARGEARGLARMEARGRELGRMEQARAMSEELFKLGVPVEIIAHAAKVNVEMVQSWLEGLEVRP